jgi:anti-sigma regulatory factor (Ser/Thr protein kinase)
VLVALPRPNLELLRGALGGDADEVAFAEMEHLGRNPARLIPAWRDFLDADGDSRGARGIGEPIWAGRSAEEIDECTRHESLLNLAFADATAPLTLLCPYDTTRLDDDVLAGAEHNHPLVDRNGEHSHSASYADPATSATGPFEGDLAPPTDDTTDLVFTVRDLGGVRRMVADAAHRVGLAPERVSDLVIAASEVATNSVRHGGERGWMRVWADDLAICCEIHGEGRISDPLVGRVRPSTTEIDGRGMWIANQFCDLVQIRSGPAGSIVRLRMDLSPPSS